MTLKLALDFRDAGEKGSPQRVTFNNNLARDLSNASGLPPHLFDVVRVSAGSIIVDTLIHPDPANRDLYPMKVAMELEKQAGQPNSPLLSGVLTRRCEGIALPTVRPGSMDKLLPPQQPTPESQTVAVTPAAGTPAETDEAKRIVSQANQLQRQNNFQEAHELYTNALWHARNDELRSAIFFNRSVVLARMKRWEESLEDANECVKINPTWPRGAECQGTALEGLGRLQEALAAFGTALGLEPGNEVRLCLRSAALLSMQYRGASPSQSAETPRRILWCAEARGSGRAPFPCRKREATKKGVKGVRKLCADLVSAYSCDRPSSKPCVIYDNL